MTRKIEEGGDVGGGVGENSRRVESLRSRRRMKIGEEGGGGGGGEEDKKRRRRRGRRKRGGLGGEEEKRRRRRRRRFRWRVWQVVPGVTLKYITPFFSTSLVISTNSW